MSTSEVKDSIIALPVQERVVAVALQHVFNEIIKIQDQENLEIQQLHQSFISRFKNIENRVSPPLFSRLRSYWDNPYLRHCLATLISSSRRLRRGKLKLWPRGIRGSAHTGQQVWPTSTGKISLRPTSASQLPSRTSKPISPSIRSR